MENAPFTTIDSIGRSGLIKRISQAFDRHDDDLIFGIGDDAAVVKPKPAEHILYSSELFTEGVDFDVTYTPLHHLGYKLVSLSVSDILAMNGKPEYLLINLGLTNKFSVEMVQLFYKGVKSACDKYEIKYIGGDIAAANHAMTASIMVTGSSNHTVYRSGAKSGDAICVTGDLGAAACGLMILLREKKHWETSGEQALAPELDQFEYVVRKQLVPDARVDLIQAFLDSDVQPTSMIDITQGLNRNLLNIAQDSGLGAIIYEAALPVSPDTRFAADDLEEDIDKFILYGGEEPELIFTLPESKVEKFAKLFKDFVVIGKMLPKESGVKMQTSEGHQMTLHE